MGGEGAVLAVDGDGVPADQRRDGQEAAVGRGGEGEYRVDWARLRLHPFGAQLHCPPDVPLGAPLRAAPRHGEAQHDDCKCAAHHFFLLDFRGGRSAVAIVPKPWCFCLLLLVFLHALLRLAEALRLVVFLAVAMI